MRTKRVRIRRGRLVAAAGFVAAVVAGCSAGASEGRTVEITIEHSHFSTGSVDVRPGERVTFVIVNNDPIDHEFIVGDRHVQDVHEKGTEAHHGARDGEISVPALSTRSTSYTFGDEPLLFGCHLPGHFAYGMKGTIEITD